MAGRIPVLNQMKIRVACEFWENLLVSFSFAGLFLVSFTRSTTLLHANRKFARIFGLATRSLCASLRIDCDIVTHKYFVVDVAIVVLRNLGRSQQLFGHFFSKDESYSEFREENEFGFVRKKKIMK